MSSNRQARVKGLMGGFLESAERFPSRPALVVNGESLTYLVLRRQAGRIASAILRREQEPYPLAALLAQRSRTAYAGILGILGSGKGYVPLNPRFPVGRTREMLSQSGCSVLVVGEECFHQLVKQLAAADRPLTVILPDVADTTALSADFPEHRFISSNEMAECDDFCWQADADPDAVAYLLFTSGSTGKPKGVPINHSNARPYIDYVCARYDVNERDRFSQGFDLTFDLSVHDMFVCWERGACLFSVPESSVMAPAKFIRDHGLTMWFSVPSVIGVMQRMRLLPPSCFPSLRYSLFCGEALPAACAQLWQQAAPRSVVENLYGPTETTIAISHYRWDKAQSPEECLHGIVPIGWIFAGQRCAVIDRGCRLPTDACGELCLSGSQVSRGYWNEAQRTEERFVRLASLGDTVWYRTGDLVKQEPNGCLHYLGRIDRQVKIRGYRAELQEVEAVLRKACGTGEVVCEAWPSSNGVAEGVIAFVSGVGAFDQNRLLARCRKDLPDYMVPSRIFQCHEMPLNANGKIDRAELVNLLEAAEA
jgi:amino acid adenylation domain-containing protein